MIKQIRKPITPTWNSQKDVRYTGSFDIDSFTVEQHFAATLASAEIGMETEASQVCGSRLIIDMQGMT
ncbi:hypothetical protein AVEN_210672-1, partial [Araneus ventricosus]